MDTYETQNKIIPCFLLKNAYWELFPAMLGTQYKLHLGDEMCAALQEEFGSNGLYNWVPVKNHMGIMCKSFITRSKDETVVLEKAEKVYASYLKECLSEKENILQQITALEKKVALAGLSHKCCQNCNWYFHEEIDDGYVCVNGDSEHVADWVEPECYCEEFAEK